MRRKNGSIALEYNQYNSDRRQESNSEEESEGREEDFKGGRRDEMRTT